MFSFIRGKITSKSPSYVEIDSNGLGFEIIVPLTTLSKIGNIGEIAQLYTLVMFRDEAFQIFGFATKEEKEIFQELIKISGVGPKVALAILSYMEVGDFINCVANNEIGKFVKLPGIGRKTAERVIFEFRNKIDKLKMLEIVEISTNQYKIYEEAISALNVLGYQEAKVRNIVLDIIRNHKTEELTLEVLLKQALKVLNR
jgi:Holliday junction DNA helicase RuvA